MDELIDVIGYQATALLAAHFGGCSIYVPLQKSLKLAVRDRLIRDDRLAGMTLNNLAIKYDLTTRRIMTICKG